MRDDTEGAAAKRLREEDFDSMKLHVGTRLQLFTHREVKPVQYFSTLIGYVREEYLLVKMPFDNGSHVILQDGEKVTIRVFTGTSICSFTSAVMRSFFHPFYYVHLEFPRTIESSSLRMATRVKVEMQAQVKRADAAVDVVMRNVSVTGALIESKQQAGAIGERIALSFAPGPRAERDGVPIIAEAVIRNASMRKASAPGAADVHLYGVQFIELRPEHQLVLQNMTYEALLADRHNIV